MTLVDSSNNDIFQKLCQKTKIQADEIGSTLDDNDACLICNTSLNNLETHTLKCNHKFHLDCIENWYITCGGGKKMITHQNFKPQTCPYCRKKGGWLPLKPGQTPVKFVHTDMVKTVIPVKHKVCICQAMLKTKPGKKCNSIAWVGVDAHGNKKFCSLHKNFVSTPVSEAIAAGTPLPVVAGKCCAVKTNGTMCQYTAKFGVGDTATHCGIHKKALPNATLII